MAAIRRPGALPEERGSDRLSQLTRVRPRGNSPCPANAIEQIVGFANGDDSATTQRFGKLYLVVVDVFVIAATARDQNDRLPEIQSLEHRISPVGDDDFGVTHIALELVAAGRNEPGGEAQGISRCPGLDDHVLRCRACNPVQGANESIKRGGVGADGAEDQRIAPSNLAFEP